MYKYSPAEFYKGRGIKFSRPKKEKYPFVPGVPKEFPDIKTKLINLYHLLKYDIGMSTGETLNYFSKEDVEAIKRFALDPTIDNLGKLPLGYDEYLRRYDRYVKDYTEKLYEKDLQAWRKKMK